MSDGLIAATNELDIGEGPGQLPALPASADPFVSVIRANHRARDVTSTFRQAAQGIRIGQLVKNDTFTLFESVQALEIMDPKMDSGLLDPGESLTDVVNLARPLLPEEVLGIIEQMLRYEMAWHQGYPLSQTLLTSLHLDHLLTQQRPSSSPPTFPQHDEGGLTEQPLLHLVLRAYCIGVMKSCDIAIEMVGSQLFFEEEDFNMHTYGHDFLTDVPDQEALELLTVANTWLLEHRNDDHTGIVFKGLRDHLIARRDFIDAFVPIQDKPLPRVLFRSCKRRLDGIKQAHALAKPVEDAFSAKMHRKLASTAPPRNPVELSFEDAIIILEAIYDDLSRALDIVNFDGGTDGLKNFLWYYAMRKHQPAAFPRAFLQSLTVGEAAPAGLERIGDLIWYDLEVSIPATDVCLDRDFWDIEHPKDIRFKIARVIDFFIERAAPEYVKLIQTLCQNQCRVRRCLANNLEDFDKLLQDFETAGQQLAQDDMDTARDPLMISLRSGVARCLELQMLQIMQWVIHLGLAQELFLPHELMLGHWAIRHFSREKSQTYISLLTLGALDKAESTLRLLRLEAKTVVEQVSFNAADGLTAIYRLCNRLGLLLSQQEIGFSKLDLQYDLRMQPFSGLACYKPPEYKEFEAFAQDKDEKCEDLVQKASMVIDEARRGISELRRSYDARLLGRTRCEQEWNEGYVNLDKVCIRAKLFLHLVAQGLAKYGEANLKEHYCVEVLPKEKQDSQWWILPTIRPK